MTGSGRGAVLFDVDGTLVDSNYLHVLAWWQAFRAAGHRVAMVDIHRTVGQGADRLVESILGRADGDVADAHSDFYGPFLHDLPAIPGAGDLLRAVKKHGLGVVLATSASEEEVTHLRAAIDADDAIDAVTHKDDAEASKPDPEIVHKALDKAGVAATDAVFVGDTVWDVEAARSAGVPCVCVLSGGIGAAELHAAGAVAVYRDVGEILDRLEVTPLGALARLHA
jgi:HAD superfamily hydrolase (TIGR01509 family)